MPLHIIIERLLTRCLGLLHLCRRRWDSRRYLRRSNNQRRMSKWLRKADCQRKWKRRFWRRTRRMPMLSFCILTLTAPFQLVIRPKEAQTRSWLRYSREFQVVYPNQPRPFTSRYQACRYLGPRPGIGRQCRGHRRSGQGGSDLRPGEFESPRYSQGPHQASHTSRFPRRQ